PAAALDSGSSLAPAVNSVAPASVSARAIPTLSDASVGVLHPSSAAPDSATDEIPPRPATPAAAPAPRPTTPIAAVGFTAAPPAAVPAASIPPAPPAAIASTPAAAALAGNATPTPAMDRDFIARNQIVERYLSGRLPLKGATDFERFCKENPHMLDELGLPERVNAGLRLLEASGKPEP